MAHYVYYSTTTILSFPVLMEYIVLRAFNASSLRFIDSKNLGLSGNRYKQIRFIPFKRLLSIKYMRHGRIFMPPNIKMYHSHCIGIINHASNGK